jgi:2-dehydropantoate 2-reductase
MQIHVIGSGAMGSIYGGLLAKTGCDVTLVDVREDHLAAINRDGLRIGGVRGEHTVRIPAVPRDASLPPADLALIFTDCNNVADAARNAKRLLKPEGYAVTLQNGIGNVEALVTALGAARVAGGVTMNSGANPEPGRVLYTNAGVTSIGEFDGTRSARIQQLAELLDQAQIETKVVDDPMAEIWAKFVHNCSTNALAAVSGLRGGEIVRTPEMSALQDRVMEEIMAVVRAKGIRLPDPDPRAKIKQHCFLRYNQPSMMQHVEQGRQTEIDALNGALVREAKALGIPVPYNEAVVAFVKGVERSRRQLLHEPPRDYRKLEEEAAREAAAQR